MLLEFTVGKTLEVYSVFKPAQVDEIPSVGVFSHADPPLYNRMELCGSTDA